MVNNIAQYDVVYADLGKNMVGSEQGGKRPCVVMQNNTGNLYSDTTIVIPLSSKIKNTYLPTHILIRSGEKKGLDYDSIALGECVRQISKERILKIIGHIDNPYEKKLLVKIYLSNLGNEFVSWRLKHC